MEKQTLTVLLEELEQELLRLGYAAGSMKFYRREWSKLQLFAAEKGELYFHERLGVEFLEAHYHMTSDN